MTFRLSCVQGPDQSQVSAGQAERVYESADAAGVCRGGGPADEATDAAPAGRPAPPPAPPVVSARPEGRGARGRRRRQVSQAQETTETAEVGT